MKKLLSFIFILMLGGCSMFFNKEVNLVGKEFVLIQENPSSDIRIGFKDEQNFYGFSGVNNFFGNYEKDGSKITLNRMGSTLMMGPEDAMVTEKEFLVNLDEINKLSYKNDTLTLTTKAGKKLNFTEKK